MKIKLANASNQQLNWLGAQCECPKNHIVALLNGTVRFFQHHEKPYKAAYSCPLNYVENWSQGGPVIEREGISLRKEPYGWYAVIAPEGKAFKTVQGFDGSGDTPLEAAMRCYVASKLGDEVEVPEKLL